MFTGRWTYTRWFLRREINLCFDAQYLIFKGVTIVTYEHYKLSWEMLSTPFQVFFTDF